ncbi:molybdopterin cofactor [Fusarium subglutinans]|uniref:Molybdopterin cofactor n=1 Tax=Gibberella subglutinans TaxID=42677 RepID=A0A8H5L9Q7_GIBSU|nr:molybdopterin cofactor [Fusarium subglutinans]KAF5586681.1 molybdopterin cofactor [Fusarium subglutinans]
MDERVHATVKWVEASVKASPYIWSAAGLTFLLGVQVLLAVAILHGDEATVRRQLHSLHRVDSDNDAVSNENLEPNETEKKDTSSRSACQVIELSPIASCATIKVKSNQDLDDQDKHNNSYLFAVDSHQADDQGFAIWKSLDQRTKPALSQIKTELWLPKSNAVKSDPLVQAGGCIVMSFADPAVPSWLDQIAGMIGKNLKTPQVACILPLQFSLDDIEQNKLIMRRFKIDGEDGKGLDLEKFPAVSDILPKLRLFLGYSEQQGITIFKRA